MTKAGPVKAVGRRRWGQWRAWALVLVAFALLHQAPNIALLLYRLGVPIASTDRLGVRVAVTNGWYPVASSDYALGKALFEAGKYYVVIYHRYSSLQPWKNEMFAIMEYPRSVRPELVERTKETAWGRVQVIKAMQVPDPGPPLYAVPGLGVAVLTGDVNVLADITAISPIGVGQ